MGWNGTGWDGMGWDGMGWDGLGWFGMVWDGIGQGGPRQSPSEMKAHSPLHASARFAAAIVSVRDTSGRRRSRV